MTYHSEMVSILTPRQAKAENYYLRFTAILWNFEIHSTMFWRTESQDRRTQTLSNIWDLITS